MPLSALLGLLAQSSTPLGLARDVVLNEFAAINDTILLDSDGEASDWIELHNVSDQAVNLAGFGLSDDPGLPFKWVFPSRTLAPRGYLVVFASNKNRFGSELHTNFKLDGGGEFLALNRPDGSRAHGYVPRYPSQLTDVSYGLDVGFATGRSPSGALTEGYFARPTPGSRNVKSGLPVEPVGFSVPRGFQDSAFSLELSCTTPGVTIWYTLDGREPGPGSGSAYAGPIAISTTTVVRAIALHPVGNSLTRSVAHTYLFANQILAQSQTSALAQGFPGNWIEQSGQNWSLGGTRPGAWYGLDTIVTGMFTQAELVESLKSIPSVSLAMPRDDWFAYDPAGNRFGVYPNPESEGPLWERRISMEFIDPTGGPETQANCMVEVQGGSSTNDSNRSQLSLALKFNSDAGPPELDFPILPDSSVDKFDYLLLDGGNQGSIHANVSTSYKRHAQGLRDQFLMNLHRDMGRRSPHGRHVHVFLNGLYWGVYNLHERPDEKWAGAHFSGEAVEYDWIKEGGIRFGNNNPVSHPTAPGGWNIVKNIELLGLDETDVYGGQPAWDALQDYVDIDDYIDYLILNFWAQNSDWPQRNWMVTGHARLSADFADENPELQYRFHSWDGEATLGWEGITIVGDPFYDRTTLRSDYDGNAVWLYTEALRHAEFKVRFGDRFQALAGPGGALFVDPAYAAMGTVYDPAFPGRNRPATLYWQLSTPLEKAFRLEYARWGNYFHAPGTVTPNDWRNERARILNEFCAVRTNVLQAQLLNQGLYPVQSPPSYAQHGGVVASGYDLALSVPALTTVHYTTDGSDPRLAGGAVNPAASAYTMPIEILHRTTVKSRALGANGWSALVEATFSVDYDLRINELMADNDTVHRDELGEFEDWIEIYNAGNVPVDLGGMFLSDDLSNPKGWKIPAGIVLAPQATVMFWADGETLDGPLHANFSLAATGEEVGLYHTSESGNLQLDALVFGPQATDLATGSLPDGGRVLTLLSPSPGVRNVPPQAVWRAFDARDPFVNSAELSLTNSTPGIGQVLQYVIDSAPAGASGTLVFGAVTLETPQANGFLLTTASLGTLPFSTDGAGHALANASIPPDPGLIGLTFYAQGGTTSALTNGLVLTLGP